MRRGIWIALAALLLVALGLAVNTARQVTGLVLYAEPPGTRLDRLAAHWDLALPAGPGPHPALVLMSGCDGVHDNMDRWAAFGRETGFATLIVDSHTPRNLDDYEAWRLVCTSQALTGAERAGDVAVALAYLRTHHAVDPDRLALLGTSHGGWTVLDFLTFGNGAEPPPGLQAWPEGSAGAAQAGVGAAVVLYPYCGAASRAGTEGWTWTGPVTMVLVADDTITDSAACRDLADRMARSGRQVSVTVLDGVTHGFDQQHRSALSPLEFDARATDRTAGIIAAALAPLVADR